MDTAENNIDLNFHHLLGIFVVTIFVSLLFWKDTFFVAFLSYFELIYTTLQYDRHLCVCDSMALQG
jgi:hypothetical protein